MLDFSIGLLRFAAFAMAIFAVFFMVKSAFRSTDKSAETSETERNIKSIGKMLFLPAWWNWYQWQKKEEQTIAPNDTDYQTKRRIVVAFFAILLMLIFLGVVKVGIEISGQMSAFNRELRRIPEPFRPDMAKIKAMQTDNPRREMPMLSAEFNQKIRIFRNLDKGVTTDEYMARAYREAENYMKLQHWSKQQFERAYEDVNGIKSFYTTNLFVEYRLKQRLEIYENIAQATSIEKAQAILGEAISGGYLMDANFDQRIDDKDLKIVMNNIRDAGASEEIQKDITSLLKNIHDEANKQSK